MKFLGVDLGWVSGASGLCCLGWQAGKLQLLDLDRRVEIADILTWIDTWVPPAEPGMIAVDAPILIANATGMRWVDRLTHRYFGHYHGGCYPANLSLPFADRTVQFGLSLEARGFLHAPALQPQQLGRYQIEVFPHAAMIHLFGLGRILKYKKGKLAERRLELARLRQLILKHLPTSEPRLELESLPPIPQTGRELKDLEDRLDSLVCAYVSAHWWYWGRERNWVLGGESTSTLEVPLLASKLDYAANTLDSIQPEYASGYIVVPQPALYLVRPELHGLSR